MSNYARVCFVVYCDLADKCQKHISKLRGGVGHITYFRPMRNGDHCDEFEAKPRDSQEPQP